MRLISAGLTHPGKVRSYNEDAFLDAPQLNLWVVADGMGGHSAGDVASAMIVERLGKVQSADDAAQFCDTVEMELSAVNTDLRKHAADRNVSLIGATVVTLLASKDFVMCGWAGDSRAYRFHKGRLERISHDHSTAQEMMDTGQFSVAQLSGKQAGNTITRAVGGEPALFVEWAIAGYEPGTQFLLCSDGLTKEVSDQDIEAQFKASTDPQTLADTLVKAALDAGGRDNVTAIVVKVPA